MKVLRGQIWTVGLDPSVANEQRGVRPCLVVSDDRFNALPIQQAVVVPLTSRARGFPHHVRVTDDGGLSRESFAMCERIRAVSVTRFGRLVGIAAIDSVDAVLIQLRRWL